MANEEGGIDTPLDLLANAVTGREDGLPGGNALGCGVMSGVSLTLTVTTTALLELISNRSPGGAVLAVDCCGEPFHESEGGLDGDWGQHLHICERQRPRNWRRGGLGRAKLPQSDGWQVRPGGREVGTGGAGCASSVY